MKILICGDSYSTDFGLAESWVTAIQQQYDVTNLSAAGVSEYKILKQLETQTNVLTTYDLVIVSHTSPNRVHVASHPIHCNGKTRPSADLLFSDVEFHLQQHPNNKTLQAAHDYFLYVFDPEYYLDMYRLMQSHIRDSLRAVKSLHLTNFNLPNYCNYDNYVDLKNTLNLCGGQVNHYDKQSNAKIYALITQIIASLSC